jgi:hypothetical protein
MAEDQTENALPTVADRRWENTQSALQDFKSSPEGGKETPKNYLEIGKAKIGQAIEAQKSEASFWLVASKDVLGEYGKKALDAFKNFPNKADFTHAAFVGTISGYFATMGYLFTGADVGLPPGVQASGTALYGAFALFTGGASAAMFKEWHQKSFGAVKAGVA